MRDRRIEDAAGIVGALGGEAAALAGAEIDDQLAVAVGQLERRQRGDAGLVDDGHASRPGER